MHLVLAHHHGGAGASIIAGVIARFVAGGNVSVIARVVAGVARIVTRALGCRSRLGQPRGKDGKWIDGGILHGLDLRVLGLLLGGHGDGEDAAEEADETESLNLHGEC